MFVFQVNCESCDWETLRWNWVARWRRTRESESEETGKQHSYRQLLFCQKWRWSAQETETILCQYQFKNCFWTLMEFTPNLLYLLFWKYLCLHVSGHIGPNKILNGHISWFQNSWLMLLTKSAVYLAKRFGNWDSSIVALIGPIDF